MIKIKIHLQGELTYFKIGIIQKLSFDPEHLVKN